MKQIVGCKAAGHTVLVEMLTEQEASGTTLIVSTEPSKQAYVLDLGPLLLSQEKQCGLKVGDRVLLQGSYVPLPLKGEGNRVLGVVDLHNIKAVLLEAE